MAAVTPLYHREELARRIGKTVTEHLEENFDDHFGDQIDGHIEAAMTDEGVRRHPDE